MQVSTASQEYAFVGNQNHALHDGSVADFERFAKQAFDGSINLYAIEQRIVSPWTQLPSAPGGWSAWEIQDSTTAIVGYLFRAYDPFNPSQPRSMPHPTLSERAMEFYALSATNSSTEFAYPFPLGNFVGQTGAEGPKLVAVTTPPNVPSMDWVVTQGLTMPAQYALVGSWDPVLLAPEQWQTGQHVMATTSAWEDSFFPLNGHRSVDIAQLLIEAPSVNAVEYRLGPGGTPTTISAGQTATVSAPNDLTFRIDQGTRLQFRGTAADTVSVRYWRESRHQCGSNQRSSVRRSRCPE